MTQAFNLSQLANNVNTSGLLNAAAGLYNQVPIANGGTGRSSVTSGNLLLGAGTSAMTELTGGTVGNVVTWNGSAWGSAAGAGGALQTFTVATTPGTWTKPATIKGIKVTVVGGGGNSGSVARAASPVNITVSMATGGGGGGGSAIRLYPAPSIPGPQPYTVGGAGGTSSFGGTAPVISATGGSTSASLSLPGSTGAQTTAGASGGVGSSGNINIGGSGGGSAILSNTPTPSGLFLNGGTGGSSMMGGGGASFVTGTSGENGRTYGGGASGAARSYPGLPAQSSPGSSGAQGVVIIEEFY
jgi:hypothetical protein